VVNRIMLDKRLGKELKLVPSRVDPIAEGSLPIGMRPMDHST
jgi:hypothetical protein